MLVHLAACARDLACALHLVRAHRGHCLVATPGLDGADDVIALSLALVLALAFPHSALPHSIRPRDFLRACALALCAGADRPRPVRCRTGSTRDSCCLRWP